MEFGQYYARLPLKKSANIVHADSLEYDWQDVAPKESLSFIIGNPPFIGSKLMTQQQRDQIKRLFNNKDGSGILDYVSGWYIKSAELIQSTQIKVAFVSTNSITQGEQVGVLWKTLLDFYHIHIHFAHRTFKWSNEAKGNAAVYCVIIGFANFDIANKYLFDYKDVKGASLILTVNKINPYLVEANNHLISKRRLPICNVPVLQKGNQPTDNGNFIFSKKEKKLFLELEPDSERWFRKFIGSAEFINSIERWCIWLVDITPHELQNLPHVLELVNRVKEFRLQSTKLATREKAKRPYLFDEIRYKTGSYLIIPLTSSENRDYIPIGFIYDNTIPSNACSFLLTNSLSLFGVLTSTMHMAWVRTVCGRLESRYRYSNEIVYNNFPWPENPSESHIQKIEQAAQKVLDARALFPESSLAVLYDPLTMPPELVKAHQELDKAVDLAYRPQPFPNEAKRMEFLFELYEKYTANLFTKEKVKKSAKKATGKAKE
jgi:hypothetical protein